MAICVRLSDIGDDTDVLRIPIIHAAREAGVRLSTSKRAMEEMIDCGEFQVEVMSLEAAGKLAVEGMRLGFQSVQMQVGTKPETFVEVDTD